MMMECLVVSCTVNNGLRYHKSCHSNSINDNIEMSGCCYVRVDIDLEKNVINYVYLINHAIMKERV